MLSISKRARYGLRAMLYLARKNEIIPTKEIAAAEKIPYQFLEQIINDLRQKGFVSSKRGAQGGYYLNKSSTEISMGDIVRFLEDEIQLADCLTGSDEHCELQDQCLAKKGWEKIQEAILVSMDNTSLSDLIHETA